MVFLPVVHHSLFLKIKSIIFAQVKLRSNFFLKKVFYSQNRVLARNIGVNYIEIKESREAYAEYVYRNLKIYKTYC